MTTQAKLYMLIVNEQGKMCVFLTPPEPYKPEPAEPEIVYDGGNHALLYRNPEDAVILDYIAEDMQARIADASEVLVVEYDPKLLLISREYMARLTKVAKLPYIEGRMLTREELKERLERIVQDQGEEK